MAADPHNAQYHHMLALVELESGSARSAAEFAETATLLNPYMTSAFATHGRALMKLREWDAASKVLEAGLRISPHSAVRVSPATGAATPRSQHCLPSR